MRNFYDLHTHSFYSDGDCSPVIVAKIAKKNNLRGVVLTDHDTILGWQDFFQTAQVLNFFTVQGIEITSQLFGVDLHILGYSQNFNVAMLSPFLKEARCIAFQRAQAIARKLKEKNIADLDIETLQRKKGNNAILRKYDIVKTIAFNYVISIEQAGKLINNPGDIAYVPHNKKKVLSAKAVIDLIHKANGIAVLAHPGEIAQKEQNGEKKMLDIIDEMIQLGIDGLEVFSSFHSKKQEKEFLKITKKFKLVKTGGSDFHGAIHAPKITLGASGIDEVVWQEFLFKLPK